MGINLITKLRAKIKSDLIKGCAKYFYNIYLYIRGYLIGGVENTNVYHYTTQKAGSQWVRSLFEDHRIRKITKLAVYPQYRYEWEGGYKSFPKYTFVPGLYLPYNSISEIKKPSNYKVLLVHRNPIDIVESWFYSMKYSHKPMGQVRKHRQNLKKMDSDAAIYYCIDNLSVPFSYIKSFFLKSTEMENIIYIKFEDLKNNPEQIFMKILDELNVFYDPIKVTEAIEDYSKEKMNKLYNDYSKYNHYRTSANKEINFNDEHFKYFKDVNGNILELMGYSDV